jgi:uncharacterized membrane protein
LFYKKIKGGGFITMPMTFTFTFTELLTGLLLIAAIVAIIIIIVMLLRLARNMAPLKETVSKLNKVLDDVSVITESAREGTTEAKIAIKKASDSIADLSKIVSTNKGTIAAMTGIINAGSSLASLFSGMQKPKVKKKD